MEPSQSLVSRKPGQDGARDQLGRTRDPWLEMCSQGASGVKLSCELHPADAESTALLRLRGAVYPRYSVTSFI